MSGKMVWTCDIRRLIILYRRSIIYISHRWLLQSAGHMHTAYCTANESHNVQRIHVISAHAWLTPTDSTRCQIFLLTRKLTSRLNLQRGLQTDIWPLRSVNLQSYKKEHSILTYVYRCGVFIKYKLIFSTNMNMFNKSLRLYYWQKKLRKIVIQADILFSQIYRYNNLLNIYHWYFPPLSINIRRATVTFVQVYQKCLSENGSRYIIDECFIPEDLYLCGTIRLEIYSTQGTGMMCLTHWPFHI